MIVRTPEGRARTVRTPAERRAALLRRFAALPPDERRLFEALLYEEQAGRPEIVNECYAKRYRVAPVDMATFIDDPYYLGESCQTLYPVLRRKLIEIFEPGAHYREVILGGSTGWGKCLHSRSTLYDPHLGQQRVISEVPLNEMGAVHVAAYDQDMGCTVTRPAIVTCAGRKSVGMLRLLSGKRVEVTPDHPVLTPTGYRAASELASGDLVGTARTLPPPEHPLEIADAEVEFVAFMLANGCCVGDCWNFTNRPGPVLDRFHEVSEEMRSFALYSCGQKQENTRRKIKSTACEEWRACGTTWVRDKYDLAHLSRHKRVPSAFFGLSDRQLGLFLNRLWATDGSLEPKAPCKAELTLASEGFVRDVGQLLLRFGVHSRIYPCQKTYTHKGERRTKPAWRLFVTEADNLERFLTAVGPVLGKEDRCVTILATARATASNTNVDIVPVNAAVLRRLRQELGPMRNEAWTPWRASRYQGRPKFVRMQQTFTLPLWCAWWGDLFWDQVVAYDPGSGELEDVYDVEVPGPRNFVADGVVVHNTTALSVIMCRLLYELSCLVNPQASYGMSPGSEMSLVLVSKNLILARQVLKAAVDSKITLSSYFQEHFKPDIHTEATYFPCNVQMIVASYLAERSMGTNAFAAALDECVRSTSALHCKIGVLQKKLSVGALLEMAPEERSRWRVKCLDHATQRVRYGRFAIRPSTVQPLVELAYDGGAVAPSLDHPVLVREGAWLVYRYARDVRVGDELAVEGQDVEEAQGGETRLTYVFGQRIDCAVCLGRGVHQCDVYTKPSAAACAATMEDMRGVCCGVRPESIRVDALPTAFRLARVTAVTLLPPEQTYAIETEFQTFVADGVVVHNTNFVRSTKQKIRTADGQQKSLAHFDHAEVTYRSLERRIKSRFVQASGDLPGMIVMVSSANTVGSFIDRRLAAAHRDPSIYAMEMATWEVKPPGSFSGRTFQVLCGGSSLRSRILPPGEDVVLATLPDEARVIAVPEEYRVDFESNLEDAIRDIAGVPTTAISVFIQRTEKIQEAVNPARRHPADHQTWQYGQPLVIHWHQLAKASVRRLPGGFTEEAWTPLRNPRALRYVHIDTSLSGDATGIACGHIERWVEVVRRTPEGDHYTDLAPTFVIDLVLQVRPPPGEQIQLADIRAVIYDIQAHGFVLIGFSTDQYQAVDTLQHMKRRGVASEILSVDATMVPYEALRSAIYERRIELYPHAPLLGELRALEHDRLRGKIDHPVAGGKDCLSGETKIAMLDGRAVPIRELVGREFWSYACDANGDVVPAWARNVHLVGECEMLRVWLETGLFFDCTPDHEVMLWAGTFCEAHALRPGDLLMPLSWQPPGQPHEYCVAHVEPLEAAPVFDMTVDIHHNFALAVGVFVHNCADAVAGVVAGLLKKVPRVPLGVLQPGEGRAEAEDFAWVTGQPGPEGEAEVPMLPFLMG